MKGKRQRQLEDLERDIRDHIDKETLDNIERGMSPENARAAALRRFGNQTRVKEDTWEVWNLTWLDSLLNDMRFSVRVMRKSPGSRPLPF